MGGRYWSDEEREKLKPALDKMEGGASIYSQIVWLIDEGGLQNRTWDGIRRQLAEGMKVRIAEKRKQIAGV